MLIKDLLDVCDSFDDFTQFRCYDIYEDYCMVNCSVCFAKLNKDVLRAVYGNCQILKFYIWHSSNLVDLLFKNS